VALANSQLFYDAFKASSIGIAVEDMDGRPLFVNPALCSMLGFSEEELRSKHCDEFSPAEDAEKDWDLFQQLQAGAIDHYQIEKRYFRRDGSLVWGRLSISLLKHTPPLVVAMVEDITEKKKAEEALRESEERLRLAQWAARIGTFDLNIQTGVDIWTPETEALYGLPPGGFGGTLAAFEDLIHPDDRERVIELTHEMMRTGQPAEGEWRVVWPDGSLHWIASHGQVFMDGSGQPSRMLGVNIDITESKRAEQALHEMNRTLREQSALVQSREELLKIFVKNAPAGVAMFDRDMRYLQVSDRWCADYSVDSAQVLGRSHYELFPDLPDRWKELHRRALEGETLRADEDRWDREGGTRWIHWEIRPWWNLDRLPEGILIFAEDITYRKQMEEALSRMTLKLVEAQEQERARIARELHDDINQRLALFAIEIEQVQERPEMPKDMRDWAHELSKQTKEICSDIQALSHELHSPKLEYLGLVGGVKSWCREFGERQGMEIEFKCSGLRNSVSPEISLCLFRVLQEALHNTAKHSSVKHIGVQLAENSGEIHLIVNDSGKGFDIEAAKQSRGLGITSMRERVRLVGGTIAIESKPMVGTTIHVRVPLRLN
jgi:PAS domain S-box-containing protein